MFTRTEDLTRSGGDPPFATVSDVSPFRKTIGSNLGLITRLTIVLHKHVVSVVVPRSDDETQTKRHS